MLRPYRIRCLNVSGQLEQILAYLDRDGVTELVISIGRPIAMKQKGAYVNLTARPLTLPMLNVLVEGSALAGAMPKTDGSFDPIELDVGRRRLRVRSGRRGDEVVLRLEVIAKSAIVATATAPAPAPVTTTFAKKPSFKAPELSLDDDVPELTLEPERATPAAVVEPQYIEVPRSGRVPPPEFSKLIAAARAAKASDLHISAGRVTQLRVGTDLVPVDGAPLSAEAADSLLLPLLDDDQRARLAAVGYVDLAVDATDRGRLRANISRHQVGLKGTFRLAMAKPATLDELGLPKDLAKVVAHHQGFVVIAGPSGHGKTTTLNALVDLINSTKAFHILTVEDPIEIEHPRKIAVVSQREAGRHTKSFAAALKASLREDPDVIVIGELRDRETVEIALTASETGHLVLATMSTPSAAKTLDRLIDMFPPEEHSQVRASIAGALRAIVAQRLVPAIGGGVVPAIELVTGVLALATLIRDDKLFQLPNLLQRGRAYGMIRFDESLLELARAGKITEDTALAFADAKKELHHQLHPQQQAAPVATVKKGLFGGDKK
ncbi:MAG TPA: PilT/PilU family type 4a pilus ATPase [Kofleriaceae bacterium]|nr:PilT/PilU family type 4a pilus ATPase [Kofleriaceae bacterium]